MVAKSVSMPSLHSTTNARGSENALRRTRAIEEVEAKGKGQVKNNGKTNYKGKDTRQSSSKAPDGFKDNPRWKKVTKEKIKPVPKSQEKVKSPKQGILKFGRKEANPTLNSNSEIVGKKKSKGKVAQDVPRRVRFHHAPPTPPVSAVSCGSRDAKRNRSGGVITSAGMYTLFLLVLKLLYLSLPPNFVYVFIYFWENKADEFCGRIVKVSNAYGADFRYC